MSRWSRLLLPLVAVVGAVPAWAAAPEIVVEAPPALARDAARVRAAADQDFTGVLEMTGMLGFRQPVRVVLAAESGELARRVPRWVAGFADAGSRTIVIFPRRVPTYPDRSLPSLLRHEVAHLLVDDAARGGRLPRWFSEGVATVAAREWGLEDRARYALAVVGRDERSLADLDRSFSAGGRRAARAYAMSAAFVRELERRFGRGVSAAILAEVGGGADFELAFSRATGADLRGVERWFFGRRALETTWIPFLTSSVALWMAITVLALAAFARRRRRRAALYERWDAEDADHDGGTEPERQTIVH